ncbi:MAG: hypothetical protein GY913_29680 [Proteobacteria bacterium]|nr:hypothetical protein [Pseudomonadota bacterium]MCP4921086.1 hypothetical protein [Pseudomonadota bacterium]
MRREEWTSFERAVVLEIDTDTGAVETRLEYTSPPSNRPDKDPSVLFKSASWDGDRLALSTQTEVLVVDPATWSIERVISHPCFNDVHHVRRIGGRLHVVSTGLDAVFVLDEDDAVCETHSASGVPIWERYDRSVDYRKVHTTKPHPSHPNYVFEAAGTRWITRFEQGDALPIDVERPPIAVAGDGIHDGELVDGSIWFTVVSGHVVQADAASGETVSRWDLIQFQGVDGPLGWCRGIRVEPDRTLVGFSRLRPTKFKQNLSWLRGALNRPEPEPSRVASYDLQTGRELERFVVEDHGLSCVFSILPAAQNP